MPRPISQRIFPTHSERGSGFTVVQDLQIRTPWDVPREATVCELLPLSLHSLPGGRIESCKRVLPQASMKNSFTGPPPPSGHNSVNLNSPPRNSAQYSVRSQPPEPLFSLIGGSWFAGQLVNPLGGIDSVTAAFQSSLGRSTPTAFLTSYNC